ncbi:ECs_2282 family putative zinc-binding protein, partial [Escherichia coli]
MKDKKFSRSISLQCPTCGTTTLLNDQDIEQVRCARCGREMTMNRLIEENGENI